MDKFFFCFFGFRPIFHGHVCISPRPFPEWRRRFPANAAGDKKRRPPQVFLETASCVFYAGNGSAQFAAFMSKGKVPAPVSYCQPVPARAAFIPVIAADQSLPVTLVAFSSVAPLDDGLPDLPFPPMP